MELNDLTFSLQNGVYKTSFQPTGDFRIHINDKRLVGCRSLKQ